MSARKHTTVTMVGKFKPAFIVFEGLQDYYRRLNNFIHIGISPIETRIKMVTLT